MSNYKGNVCAVNSCKRRSPCLGYSFFRFPKDPVSIRNISNNDVRPTNSNIIFSRSDLDYRNCLTLNCKNIIKYKCGFLIKKCLTKHTCEVCENYSMAHQSLNENNL